MPARRYMETSPRKNPRKRNTRPNPKTNNKKRLKRNQRRKNKDAKPILKLIALIILFSIFIGSLLFLFKFASLTEIRAEVTELENIKNELEKDKMDLIAELETIKSNKRIEEEAIKKLGMSTPKEDQIVYISIDKEDTKNTNTNLLSKLMDMFNK